MRTRRHNLPVCLFFGEHVQVDCALSHKVVFAVKILVVHGDFEYFALVGKRVQIELLVPFRIQVLGDNLQSGNGNEQRETM